MAGTWHAVYTKHNSEHRAKRRLTEQGFPIVLPMCRMGSLAPTPLFPRYLFLELNENRPPRPIRSTPGVVGLVLAPGGRPAVVPDDVVDALRDAPIRLDQFTRGDCVQITEGPLSGFSGVCVTSGTERMIVLLSILGRPVETALAARSLQKI